ncbi:MAG: nucleotidyltransferase family protein [Rhodospirillales bacterium]|jgi:hypothetical protein
MTSDILIADPGSLAHLEQTPDILARMAERNLRVWVPDIVLDAREAASLHNVNRLPTAIGERRRASREAYANAMTLWERVGRPSGLQPTPVNSEDEDEDGVWIAVRTAAASVRTIGDSFTAIITGCDMFEVLARKRGRNPNLQIRTVTPARFVAEFDNTIRVLHGVEFDDTLKADLEKIMTAHKVPGEPFLYEFRVALEAAFPSRVQKAVLFGSRARGDATQESDWDVAVFIEDYDRAVDQRHLVRTSVPFRMKGHMIAAIGIRSDRKDVSRPLLDEIDRDGLEIDLLLGGPLRQGDEVQDE